MSTYAALRSLLDQVRLCMSDADSCDYAYYVSMGMPSADCNSIVAWLDSKDRAGVNPECRTSILDTTMKVMLTRCCAALDAQESFDPALEQAEAECFLNDLDLLANCINCNLTEQEGMSCGYKLRDIIADNEREGGCYSATLTLEFTEEDCCE